MGRAARANGRERDLLYVPTRVRELVDRYIRTPEQLEGLIMNFAEGPERDDAAPRLIALFKRQADERARGRRPSPSIGLPDVVEWPRELESMRTPASTTEEAEPDRVSATVTH